MDVSVDYPLHYLKASRGKNLIKLYKCLFVWTVLLIVLVCVCHALKGSIKCVDERTYPSYRESTMYRYLFHMKLKYKLLSRFRQSINQYVTTLTL